MGKVLIEKKHKNTGTFLEILDDGKVKAGQYEATARLFESADVAYAHFRPKADSDWAWNICYLLEDYISKRDEGC